jgi:hypothetical protein
VHGDAVVVYIAAHKARQHTQTRLWQLQPRYTDLWAKSS